MKSFAEKLNLTARLADSAEEENRSTLDSLIFFLLAATLVFTVAAFGAVDAWALGFLSVTSGAILILWLADAWRKKEFRFSPTALQLPLFGLLLIGLIQLLPIRSFDNSGDLLSVPAVSALSLDAYATRLFVIQLIVYIIFFAASLAFIGGRRIRKIVLTMIVFGAFMAFVGILQRLASPDAIYGFRRTPQAIAFASFVNQHHFAALMNMTLGLTLGLLFGKSTKKDLKPLLIIAGFMMLVAISFTGSRGALLSFAAMLGFLALPKIFAGKNAGDTAERRKKTLSGKFLIIAGALAGVVFLVGTSLYLGGEQSLLRLVGLEANQTDVTSGRTHFWAIAVRIFLDYPILGVGLNAFGAAFSRYDSWNGMFRIEQAHNDYLQILADAGIFGFACVAAFIYLLFKKSLPAINSAADAFRSDAAFGALAGCFAILVHSFFDFPLRTPANTFFFLTLAAIATTAIAAKRQKVG